MMPTFRPPHHLRRRVRQTGGLLLALTATGIVPAARAAATEDDVTPLGDYVVSAARSPHDAYSLPSYVSLLSLDELSASEVGTLPGALAQQPGAILANTGAVGGQSSIMLRGASSHQTLFIVDGVRMNDRSASYLNFLGGADLAGLDRLELLRGPQGTLYGSSAMGGVILLETAHAGDELAGSLRAGLGSFDTRHASAAVSARAEPLGLSASLGRYATANDRPGNDYRSWTYSGRLELAATERLTLGATLRGLDGDYEEPGPVAPFFPSPGVVDLQNRLATAYAEWRPADGFVSRLTAGLHRRDYSFASDWGVNTSANRREILDWTAAWTISPAAEIVAGANYERSRYAVDAETTRDRMRAGFVSGTWMPIERLTLIGGVRHDDYDSAGGATTWRTGASWQVAPATRLRGTYGTAFSAPGSDDRWGVASWGQLENPGLQPEKSRGWDAGIEQHFNTADAAIAVTWFDNRFTNLFEWETVNPETYQGRIVNRARAFTRGLELAVAARPMGALRTRLAYTWLEAETDDGSRLARRPRHTVDGEVAVQATRDVLAGVGLHGVADRAESFGARGEDYVTLRAFASWQVREELTVRARIENLLDADYAEVPGYPALPFGVYAGAEWTF